MSGFLRLLCGTDLETENRNCCVTSEPLAVRRLTLLAAREEGLKIRHENLVDERGRRKKQAIAGLAMERELMRECIRSKKDHQPDLYWRWKR